MILMSEFLKNEATGQLALEIEELLRRVDALPTLDLRPESEILGYGDDAPKTRITDRFSTTS